MDLTDCTTIVTSPAYNGVVQEIQSQMQLTSLPCIKQQDYRSNAEKAPKCLREVDREKESGKVAWIIHSSGSTGFPKPVFITNIGALSNFRSGLSLRVFTISPLFHSHALFAFGRALYHRQIMFFGNHQLPVTRPHLVAALRAAQPDLVWAVPYVLEILAERDDGVVELAKVKMVIFAGSACPDHVGDKLVSNGVNLIASYGATETGFVMNSMRPPGDNDWKYMRLPAAADLVHMDEVSPGVFECVILDGFSTKVATNTDDPPGAFRTRDLFTRHPDPTKSNYWRYLSRLDDRLTLVNGEKVLPVPVEDYIRQSELVKEVVVFGIQRTLPGAIIFRGELAADLLDEDFLDQVWPRVEEANDRTETFSRITRELVIVRPFDEPYPRTDKGTFIRAQLYEQYKEQIAQAYERFEAGTATDGHHLLELDLPALEAFLLARFREDLRVPLDSVDSDIFSAGVDSLQTARMWHIIKKELSLGSYQADLPHNIVFERGSVKSLAKYLHNLRLGIKDTEHEDNSDRAEIQEMQNLIDRYSTFTPHKSIEDRRVLSSKTVLLTGVTGGLGSFLLANLLKRQDVSRVYCLVRASDTVSALSRALEVLEVRDLIRDLPENFQDKLVAFSGDIRLPWLGLDSGMLKELLSNLTHIIHSAWAVNFNHPLHSFEPHIRGVYNLLENLALRTTHSAPAKFFFCSSVAAVSATPKKQATIPETQVFDLSQAQSTGYGRSKLVAERITHAAAIKSPGCVATVLRIGQLAGDTMQAVWNDSEAVALMVRSALPTSASCLPTLDESPSWLPIDSAAQAIEQLTLQENDEPYDPDLVYHIVNPCTFSFTADLVPMLRAHTAMPSFELVDTRTWLERLRASDDDIRRNPSRKLIDFWEGKYRRSATQNERGNSNRQKEYTETSRGLKFETTKTVRDCRMLGEVSDPVSSGLMYRIVDVWVEKWKTDPEKVTKEHP